MFTNLLLRHQDFERILKIYTSNFWSDQTMNIFLAIAIRTMCERIFRFLKQLPIELINLDGGSNFLKKEGCCVFVYFMLL